ncbi:Protein CBG13556 [Caenorhabditis briggsae]|uniref:Protein CBG13556 n=1 Tax=Caenorhabditis briggsae TaxID=6238 RepID=A8XI63_CAEBR|nr:Protein CBG13556 [Caenorhabditis briggsae]CAP32337.2 Protein CBG13556 [Caenorhabditis briggsae]
MKCVFLALLVQIVASQSCYENSDRLIGSRCYKFINQKLSYQDARNWCHSRSSYLATVPDLYTDTSWLVRTATARTLFNDNEGKFWIGLSRSNNKWTWDDGTPYVWNNWEIQNSQNYATESIKNGKWNGYTPDTRLNFICSYFPNGGPTPEASTISGASSTNDPGTTSYVTPTGTFFLK